ncbi:hypothetical protein [Nocardia sp. NPDC050406]
MERNSIEGPPMHELPAPDLVGTLTGYLLMSPMSVLHNLGQLLAALR